MYIFDAHNDTLMQLPANPGYFAGNTSGHVDLPRMQKGEVAAQIFAVFTESHYRPGQSLQRSLAMIDSFWNMVNAHPEALGAVLWAEDLAELRQQGRIAALLSLEGAEPLGVDLHNLRIMHRLGVRAITLTWNHRNAVADGAEEEERAGGLSVFGRQVVDEMARLGMVVDVSHLAEPGFWDVMQTEASVIASHSNAAGLHPHRRNLSDAQLRALAERGGVVGVNFHPGFISSKEPQAVQAADLYDHIEYLLDIMGENGVGLGSDYDGITNTPQGLEDASTFPRIVEGLAKRGLQEGVIAKVMGENFYRIFCKTLPNRPSSGL